MKTKTLKAWEQAKKEHDGAMLLFQVGDFYECFKEDAETLERVCGLRLTESSTGLKMCGFPMMRLDDYLPQLVEETRVVVCDRVAEPQE